MTCEDPFTCAEQIDILGWTLDGVGWFLLMITIAFVLQVAANFVWTKNGQVSRELMKLKIEDRGDYYIQSLVWTGISTIISITRIVLIGGNNLYVFITILIGNLVGTYWAQSRQHADKYCISQDILQMLNKMDNSQCSIQTRDRINLVIDKLAEEIEKRHKVKKFVQYKDNITF